MKNSTQILAVILCSALLSSLAACTKEALSEDAISKKEIVTIQVGLESDENGSETEEDSKIAISDDAQLVRTAWQSGDKLLVVAVTGSDTVEEDFDINPGFTRHHASFTGDKPVADNPDEYTIQYPHGLTHIEVSNMTFSGKTQNGNGGTDHLAYCAQLSGIKTFPSEVMLTSAYAKKMGYTLKRSSVIKFRLKLPTAVTEVKRIELVANPTSNNNAASARIFYASNQENSKTNTLCLYVKNGKPTAQVFTAYMAIPWHGYKVAAGQVLNIKVYDSKGKIYSKAFSNTKAQSFTTGNQSILYQLDMTKGTSTEDNTSGEGTSSNPHKVSSVDDLLSLSGKLKTGETTYFKLENDIDLAGIDWTPINNTATSYNRFIDFNGNGKLIKNLQCKNKLYASFFGVLEGKCYDVGFVNANISAEGFNRSVGIIASYLGERYPNQAEEYGVIERCYTTGVVDAANNYAGGIVGIMGTHISGNKNIIRDCYSTALIKGASGGGLTSATISGNLVERSYFGGAINISNHGGGLIGHTDQTGTNGKIYTPTELKQCISMARVLYSGKDSLMLYCRHQNNTSRITLNQNHAWDGIKYGKTAEERESTDLVTIKTNFNNYDDSSNAWDNSTYGDGIYPLLNWQVTRGDYDTYSGHKDSYFASGNGTKSAPYEINEPFQVYEMDRKMTLNDSTYFKLTEDLDLTRIAKWTPLNRNEGEGFKKHIDLNGNNKTLSNLTINYTENEATYQGFFCVLSGWLRNITFNNFKVTQGNNQASGIVAGYISNSGTGERTAALRNVTVDGGSITATNCDAIGSLGGAVGYNSSLVNCSSSATITNNTEGYTTQCGGLIGRTATAHAPLLNNCSFSGTITSKGQDVGGLIGRTTYGSNLIHLKNCYTSNATISGTGYVGGLIGYAQSGSLQFTNCYSRGGSVTGSMPYVGGLVGYGEVPTSITKCYVKNTNIIGYGRTGGLVGNQNGGSLSISESYYSGGTIQSKGTGENNYHVGGILGSNAQNIPVTITNCYSRGTIKCASQGAGGIIGVAYGLSTPVAGTFNTEVSYCISDCTIETQRNGGGIIGNAANGGIGKNGGGVMVKHCVCWSPSIVGISKDGNYYSCGAIIGFTAVDNILFHCWYNKNMVLEGPDSKIAEPINKLVQQNRYGGFNVSDALWNSWGGENLYKANLEKTAERKNPMVPGTTPGTSNTGAYTYINPYHGGMVNDDNYSARMIAHNTHFDSTIWDLNGNYDANYIMPKLKNNKEQ